MCIKKIVEHRVTIVVKRQSPLKQPQRVFRRDGIAVNAAFYSAVAAEESAYRFQFHAVLFLFGGALVGHGVQHAPTVVAMHHHPHMGVDAVPVKCRDSATLLADTRAKRQVTALQLHRVGHRIIERRNGLVASCEQQQTKHLQKSRDDVHIVSTHKSLEQRSKHGFSTCHPPSPISASWCLPSVLN